jgi:hypothetical protein
MATNFESAGPRGAVGSQYDVSAVVDDRQSSLLYNQNREQRP